MDKASTLCPTNLRWETRKCPSNNIMVLREDFTTQTSFDTTQHWTLQLVHAFFPSDKQTFLRAYFDAKIIHNLNLAILILSFSICISKVWWQRVHEFYTVQKCEYHLYFSKYSWIYGCLSNPNNICTGHSCLGSQMISWTIWAETINRQKNVSSLAKQIAEQSITRKWKKKYKLSVEKK